MQAKSLFRVVISYLLMVQPLFGSQLFFSDPTYSFEALRTLSASSVGGADVGESMQTIEKIKDGDDESWYQAWKALAERVENEAAAYKMAGHKKSASDAFLRASNYYRTAEFFLHSTAQDSRILATWQKSKSCFLRAVDGLAVQEVKIPFENSCLPGYLCLVDKQPIARPLLIIQTGFDGTAEELYIIYGQAALARGYNCLIFEGPGQGQVIREQGIPFRPNWESVVTPVVDFALSLPQVDKEKIALMGISLGGYFVPRALAFEKRIKVGIANGGVYDFHEVCMRGKPKDLEQQLDIPQAAAAIDAHIFAEMKTNAGLRWAVGNGMYTFGAKTPSEWLRMTRPYTLKNLVKEIRCPMLVAHSEHDVQMAHQGQKLFDALQSPKTYLFFRTDEGAGEHCQIGAYRLSNERIFNWLDQQLGIS